MLHHKPTSKAQDFFVLCYDHAQATADTTVKLLQAHRTMRIDRIKYVNPTGLAAHATNFFNLKLQNGATVIGNWSTESGEEGTLAAGTFVDFTMAADADQGLVVDDVLSLVLDEDGTATLPAGRIQIEGRYL